MSPTKKPSSAKKNVDVVFGPAARRTFLAGVDPIQLSELLDRHFTDNGGKDGSAYRQLYQELLEKFLAHDKQAVGLAAVLNYVDTACIVEDAMRQAGFVVGFECCRQLLLGELDLELLKGSAPKGGSE